MVSTSSKTRTTSSQTGTISSTTSPTLDIQLQNTSTSDVYAYITGYAIDNNGALCLLQADGKTPYYPPSPSGTVQPVQEDISIPVAALSSTTVVIPHLSSGRIYFSVGDELSFFLNPGPALVEPSVSNKTDSNYNKIWSFCEFTFDSTQLFANLSYVDFVCLPISLSIQNMSGAEETVPGLEPGGFTNICQGLIQQNKIDGAGWDQLIVTSGGGNIRVMSPNTAIAMNQPPQFEGYFSSYVSQVWAKYASTPLTIDTQQTDWGLPQGEVTNGLLTFPGVGSFAQPSAADIFSCSTGPIRGGGNQHRRDGEYHGEAVRGAESLDAAD